MPANRFLLLPLIATLGGCASPAVESAVMRGVQLGNYRNAYVACHADDDAHLCALIAKQLSKYGITAVTGPALPVPADAGALVTYEDTWTWDVTTYLFTLRIDIRNPATNLLLATSRASRTRFGAGAPEAMVRDAVAQLFAAES